MKCDVNALSKQLFIHSSVEVVEVEEPRTNRDRVNNQWTRKATK